MSAPDGTNPWACQCASPALHSIFLSDSTIENNNSEMLLQFRAMVFEAAEDVCIDLVDASSDFSDCGLIVEALQADDAFPALFQEGQPGECAAGGNFGADTGEGMENMPGDNYTDYYTLGSVVTWNQTQQRYDIDADFFDDMLDNPGWILNDSARLVPISGGYKVSGVTAGEVAAALGLQDNDVPKTLNSLDVSDIPALMETAEALMNETSFTLEVKRSGSIVSIDYEVR